MACPRSQGTPHQCLTPGTVGRGRREARSSCLPDSVLLPSARPPSPTATKMPKPSRILGWWQKPPWSSPDHSSPEGPPGPTVGALPAASLLPGLRFPTGLMGLLLFCLGDPCLLLHEEQRQCGELLRKSLPSARPSPMKLKGKEASAERPEWGSDRWEAEPTAAGYTSSLSPAHGLRTEPRPESQGSFKNEDTLLFILSPLRLRKLRFGTPKRAGRLGEGEDHSLGSWLW